MSHPASLAEILDDLCRDRISNTALAKAISDLGGEVSSQYVSALRNGHRDNPTLEVLEYLAEALDVSPVVFVGGRRERRGDERPREAFSRRLNHLFAVVYPLGRGPWTPEDAAASITSQHAYGPISPSYIRELLAPPSGTLPNPRLKHLLGLANLFGLSRGGIPYAGYFLDQEIADEIDAELADLDALRSAGVMDFVTRAAQHGPKWRPELRQQAVEAFTRALEDGDAAWVFRAPRPSGEGDDDG